MRILITGVTGFVGSHLADYLVHQGDEVIGTSYEGRWRFGVPERTRNAIGVRVWDITREAEPEIRQWISDFNPEAIVHLAGASVPADCGQTQPNPRAIATNVEGTRHIWDLASRLQTRPHFVLASSCHVYAPQPHRPHIVSESDEPAPSNGYGKTKLMAEQLCRERSKAERVPLTIVRGFQHTGPRQAARMLLPEWTLQAVRGANRIEVRCLNTYLDLMDVRDTVAMYAALARQPADCRLLNVGCGAATHGSDILEALSRVAERELVVESQQDGPRYNPVAAMDRLQSALDIVPTFSLDATVRATWDFWQSRILSE